VIPRTLSRRRVGWVVLVVVVGIVLLTTLLGRLGSRSGGDSGTAPAGPTRTDARPTLGPEGPQASGEWTFDEGAGRAAADTAGGSPIALQDGAGWTQDGQSGPAVVFDGARGYGEASRSVVDAAGNWTVTAWVRLDRVPDGFASAVSEDGGPDSVLALQYAPTGHWAVAVPGNVRALSDNPPVRGRWTHLAGVRDTSTGQLTLYVDGTAQGSVPYPGRPGQSGPLAVGRGLSNGAKVQFFPGAVDSVRVYGGALTPEEVRSAYQSGQ
jgi:Concanavalin A-like lectin/glucanases superfamily